MHILCKGQVYLCSSILLLYRMYIYAMQLLCGFSANYIQSPLALSQNIIDLHNATLIAYEANDSDFEAIEKAIKLLNKQFKTNATLIVQTLLSVRSSFFYYIHLLAPSTSVNSFRVENSLSLLTHAVQRMTKVIMQIVSMLFIRKKHD